MLTNSTRHPPYSLIYHYSPIDLQKKDQHPWDFSWNSHKRDLMGSENKALIFYFSKKEKKKEEKNQKKKQKKKKSWSERIELSRSILDKKLKIFIFIFFSSNVFHFIILLGRGFPTMSNLLSFLKYSKSCCSLKS